ncbi:MAG: hypothetical protein ACP5OO_01800 [Chloroflexia bacterium]
MSTFFRLLDGELVITRWGFLLLFALPTGIIGLRRGWQEEGYTAIGLGIIITTLGHRFGDFLIFLLNRIVDAFRIGASIVIGTSPPSPGPDLIPTDSLWAQAGAFALMTLVAYRAGTILGRRRGIGLLGHVGGGLFGLLNGTLILARVLELFQPLEEETHWAPPDITIEKFPSSTLGNITWAAIGGGIALLLLIAWLYRRRARE